MPKVGLIDEQYRDMDTAQVFHQIYDSLPEGDDGSGLGDGMDEHDWDGAEQLTEEEKGDLEREVEEAIRQGDLLPVSWAVVVPVTLRSYSNRRSIGVMCCVSSSVQRVLVRTFLHGRDPIAGSYLAGVYMPSGISRAGG